MRTFFFSFLVFIFTSQIFSNPIISFPPLLISEIYWDKNDNWTIELYADNGGRGNLYSNDSLILDSIRLISLTDTVSFKKGLKVIKNGVMLITKSDLTTPFNLNKNGDILGSIYCFNNNWISLGCDVRWGNVQYSQTKSPKSGQSLVALKAENNNGDPVLTLVKNNHPTLGYSPLKISDTNNLGILHVTMLNLFGRKFPINIFIILRFFLLIVHLLNLIKIPPIRLFYTVHIILYFIIILRMKPTLMLNRILSLI